MVKLTKFNRQKNDYLLTDLLPYEKGNHYTHRYFYDFLQKRKKFLNKLINDIKNNGQYFGPKWHSAPLKFLINKKKEESREISLINPLGLIESLVFISLFESDLLNIIHNKESFSFRKAFRTNSLVYKKENNQTVYYSDKSSKQQLIISLESSGTYFKQYPFKTISGLLNSNVFAYCRDKYSLLLMIDIQECFQSIYTHSFKWLITNKSYDSKKLNGSSSLYSNIDSFMQNLNGSKTNGIIVGPEISRLLSDFLLTHIDEKIIESLAEKGKIQRTDYYIFRFVDDYFIFTNDEPTQKLIKDIIKVELSNFQLKINEFKVTKISNEDNVNNWISELTPLIQTIDEIFPSKDEIQLIRSNPQINDISRGILEVAASNSYGNSNAINKIKYNDLKNKSILLIKSTREKKLISSYILSTIVKKVERMGDVFSIKKMNLKDFFNFIFYIYSLNVSYTSTQKMTRILSLVLGHNDWDVINAVESSIERFENEIFTKYQADWIDLTLILSTFNIQISYKSIEKIKNSLINSKNPLHLSALCLLHEAGYIQSENFTKKINHIIYDNVKRINWTEFFQDDLSWWVFIFLSYPKLDNQIFEYIRGKVNCEKLKLTDEKKIGDNSDLAKLLVIDFLLENDQHFIEWNFTSERYYEKFYFYTKDRTVFNPNTNDLIHISI
ncbi:RNA-directed DNA polymerase [Bacillus altitudinis]|uniref:RNA-directed DNA polymerase n=1 Tax=Bacillus altitudinis TaxID=293387 RepID=UPI0024A9CFEA|nr:RNA-directed DNA polymerase [Bacillus altitudinis]MDI6647932.1 RNA-directed DNA polymerase [Bacillus altitudinis]MDI6662556.1 RNA-directed DNA polymerase [Bacillus altitudinis]